MAVLKKEYEKMNKKASPPTKSYVTIPTAFVVGGLICMLGQWLCDLYMSTGMVKEDASSLSSITLVFVAAIFTGLGLFGKLAKWAGAGTLVPITGFSNAVTSMAMESKSEGLILGLGAKIFTIAGPVIVYGVCASVVYGIIYYIIDMMI